MALMISNNHSLKPAQRIQTLARSHILRRHRFQFRRNASGFFAFNQSDMFKQTVAGISISFLPTKAAVVCILSPSESETKSWIARAK